MIRVDAEKLPHRVAVVRWVLLGAALVFLFVIPVPGLPLVLASAALILRILTRFKWFQEWLIRHFAIR